MRLLHGMTAITILVSSFANSATTFAQYSDVSGNQRVTKAPDSQVLYSEDTDQTPHFQSVLPNPIQQGNSPAGFQGWPQISPYDSRYVEHYNENGLWFRESRAPSNAKYDWGVNAVFFRLRQPEEALFGNKAFRLADSSTVGLLDPIVIGRANGSDHTFDNDFKTEGIAAHFGMEKDDGTGMQISGWWATDVTEQFKVGQDADPSDPATTIASPAIPVNNGAAGDQLRFNRLFRIRYSEEAFHAKVDFMRRAWWGRGSLIVRPMWGFHYLHLREGLLFDGVDGPALFSAALSSNIRSHLYGPHLGFQAKIGSDNFRIVAGTRFILYVNSEKIRLTGSNFGNPTIVNTGFSGSFSKSTSNTHISPAFEQSIKLEAKLFSFVPVLNRVDILNNTTFQLGFTFFNVAEVARPGRSIVFNGLPLIPAIRVDRSKWSFNSLEGGFVVRY